MKNYQKSTKWKKSAKSTWKSISLTNWLMSGWIGGTVRVSGPTLLSSTVRNLPHYHDDDDDDDVIIMTMTTTIMTMMKMMTMMMTMMMMPIINMTMMMTWRWAPPLVGGSSAFPSKPPFFAATLPPYQSSAWSFLTNHDHDQSWPIMIITINSDQSLSWLVLTPMMIMIKFDLRKGALYVTMSHVSMQPVFCFRQLTNKCNNDHMSECTHGPS